jgi:cell division transport system permease protein
MGLNTPILFFKRAMQDIFRHRLLNAITIITIALSVLIVSAFGLLFMNVEDLVRSWEKGVRIMAYLKADTNETIRKGIEETLRRIPGVIDVHFTSREEALETLKAQMKHQKSLLDGLRENPLPEAMEIRLLSVSDKDRDLESIATQIQAIPGIEEVEYGRQWIGKVIYFFQLFRLAGLAMGGLFLLATISIVANTIRLLLYSRQTEIEIMRLVGATDRFIKAPFYIEGLIQGFLGAIVGLSVLAAAYFFISSNMLQGLSAVFLTIRFFSSGTLLAVIAGSMLVGWIGCFLSLKQFLKS